MMAWSASAPSFKSPLVAGTRLGVRAVKARLHDYDFHFDVVPALQDAGGERLLPRRLPDENLDDWTLEHPVASSRRRSTATPKRRASTSV